MLSGVIAYFDSCFSGARNTPSARVRVAAEVRLAAAAIRYVRVELGRAEVGMAEHLLDAAEVGAALEQVRRERVAQQVRMDAFRLEAGAAARRRRIRNAPAG